ncbi:MAG: peptidylprolyl isomerase, partial [Marinobacter alexandrii]
PFDHEGLVRQLFSTDVVEDGYNTELIDVGDNVSVVARVREYRDAQQLALEEVAADVRASLKAQETRAALSKRAEEIIAGLESGQSLSELGAGDWVRYEAKSRNDQDAGAAVMRAVFSLSRPAEGEVSYGQSVSGSSAAVVALDGVNEGAVDETSAEFGQLEEFLASLEGQREYGAYQQFLRNRAEVERP